MKIIVRKPEFNEIKKKIQLNQYFFRTQKIKLTTKCLRNKDH